MINFRKIKKDKKLIDKILSETKFIKNYCINAKIYAYYHNINSKPLCPVCKTPLKFKKNNPNRGFQKYCSQKCLNEAKRLKIIDKKKFNNVLNRDNVIEYLFSHIITKMKSKNGNIFNKLIANFEYRIDEDIVEYMKLYINFNTNDISELIYCFINSVKNRPICKNCNYKDCNYINVNSGYYEYCSNKCAASSKDKLNKTRETWIKNYGVDNPMKSKDIIKDLSNTFKQKYNVTWYSKSDEYKKKIKNTSLYRYGVEHPMKSDVIKEKQRNTLLKKYGVTNSYQINRIKKKLIEKYGKPYMYGTDYFKKKSKETNIEKYEVDNISQIYINHIDEWLNDDKFIHIYDKLESVEDIANYYNVTSSAIHKRSRKLDLHYKPVRQFVTIKKIGQIIKQFGYSVEYNNRSIIKPLEIDIVIRKDNKIIKCLEYNGLMFHSLGISSISKFNNWNRYRDNIEQFTYKDKIKLNKCNDLDIELFILREDIYLKDNSIIDKWLNSELKYKILDQPVIYRFKNMNNLEIISIEEVESSIENRYRVYFDWIKII